MVLARDPAIKADLWLTFTGMAYGFEVFVTDATQTTLVLELKPSNAFEANGNQEFALFQEILATPASLKPIEIRIFTDERPQSQNFTTLTSSRLPNIRRNSRTQTVEISLSEVFGISATEQSNWTRFVDRTFLQRRV